MTSPTPDHLVIRRATSQDAAGFARLMGEPAVYAQLLQMPYASEAQWAARLDDKLSASPHDLQLVAEREGDEGLELVGSAGLHATGTSPRRRHVMALGISVAPTAQRQGIGNALMQALCDYADGWVQVLRIELTVYVDNAPAIALYRRFGFEIEGTHRAHALRDGVYVDSYAMARLHPNQPALR